MTYTVHVIPMIRFPLSNPQMENSLATLSLLCAPPFVEKD